MPRPRTYGYGKKNRAYQKAWDQLEKTIRRWIGKLVAK